MAEQLFIRLSANSSDSVHWLVWSDTEQEIIASGVLNDATALDQLTEKAQQRKVIVLLAGDQVTLKQLSVPAKSKAAIQAAAPYMLEDELAQDVEQLFFAYGDIPSDQHNCFIAAISRQVMVQCLAWLEQAAISPNVMLPETLAMPLADEKWQAINFEQQIVLRQASWQGTVIDQQLWSFYCQQWQSRLAEDGKIAIDSFGQLPDVEQVEITQQPEELPLALYARHWQSTKLNLLQGPFKQKSKRSPLLKTWGVAAGLAVTALLLNLLTKGITLWQIDNQQAAVEQQIIAQYQKAFPETKRVRISTVRSQLKRKMASVGGTSSDADFLSLLSKVEPVFKQVPNMKPESLKYDGKRHEIRMNATAKNYQDFERFSQLLAQAQLSVSQGAQNNQDDGVSGSFSISTQGGR